MPKALYPGLIVILLLGQSVCRAGVNHDAAMAIVHNGETISNTGNLDAAMEEYSRVEAEYPGEVEAIGWARFRIAECLLAGGRFSEAASALTPVWSRIQSGEIQSPEQKFWCGSRYAKCLSHGDDSWLLAQVAGDTYRLYEEMATPGPGMEQMAGWLRLWSARCFLKKDQYGWAKDAATTAWETGKSTQVGTLAAWGRLYMAQAELGLENVLGAQSMLLECANSYGPHEGQTYRTELDTADAVCRLELGLSEEVAESLVEMLENNGLDRGGVLGTVHRHASEALASGATEEAIGPLAVAWTCHPDFPGWGKHLGILWDQKVRGSEPDEVFVSRLGALKNTGSALQRAAVRIQMAEVLSEMERPEDARTLLEEAKAISSDPRLDMPLRVAQMHCEYPVNKFTHVSAYDEIIAEGEVDQARAEFIAEKVRRYYWRALDGFTYGDWLDKYQSLMSNDFYRLQKAWWLRDDRRKQYDAALELLEPILQGSSALKWKAHASKIICLNQARRYTEAEAAVPELQREILNLEEREHALFEAAAALMYSRPEKALFLAENGLTTRYDPTWTNDFLLIKGMVLKHLWKYEEAIETLEELVSLPPDGIVGEGMMFLAGMYINHRNDLEGARGLYEQIISRFDIMPHIQAETYRHLAELEESEGNLTRAIEICDEGLAHSLRSDWRGRGWLRMARARLLFRTGDSAGREELEDLAKNFPSQDLRKYARHYLNTGGVK